MMMFWFTKSVTLSHVNTDWQVQCLFLYDLHVIDLFQIWVRSLDSFGWQLYFWWFTLRFGSDTHTPTWNHFGYSCAMFLVIPMRGTSIKPVSDWNERITITIHSVFFIFFSQTLKHTHAHSEFWQLFSQEIQSRRVPHPTTPFTEICTLLFCRVFGS